jgi:hypothetical protein
VPLTEKQERFAEFVASGRSQQKAAEAAGISPRQARTWLKDNPELREKINELSADMQRQSVRILEALLTSAAVTLGEMMKPERPDQIRLAAAREVFDSFLAMKQYTDLLGVVEGLKQQVAELMGARS